MGAAGKSEGTAENVASWVPGGREHPFGSPPASFNAVLVVRM